jgi:hypothetical protein
LYGSARLRLSAARIRNSVWRQRAARVNADGCAQTRADHPSFTRAGGGLACGRFSRGGLASRSVTSAGGCVSGGCITGRIAPGSLASSVSSCETRRVSLAERRRTHVEL